MGFDGNVHTVLTQRSHFGAEEGIGLSFSSGNFSVEYKINKALVNYTVANLTL